MAKLFFRLGDNIRKNKVLFGVLLILTIIVGIIAVYSAINFEMIAITIDIGNVTFVKFLKGDTSFLPLIFGTLLAFLVFLSIITICFSKKFLLPFAILFYLYFVYSQVVILTSLIVIYGFFNTLILLFLLITFNLLEFFVFIAIMLELFTICGSPCFFKDCFNTNNSCFLSLLIIMALLVFAFCLILAILKSFVILLVF